MEFEYLQHEINHYQRELALAEEDSRNVKALENSVIEQRVHVDHKLKFLNDKIHDLEITKYKAEADILQKALVSGFLNGTDYIDESLHTLIHIVDSIRKLGVRFASGLNYEIINKALENNLCPSCLEELEVEEETEVHNHLDESPEEKYAVRVCRKCGWNDACI